MGDETELIKKAREGDKGAFISLIKMHEKRIYAAAYKLLGNCEDVSEACQEAFLRAYRHFFRFRGEASFYTWLYRVVVNVCYKFYRSHNLDPLFKSVPLDRPYSEDVASVMDALGSPQISPVRSIEIKEEIDAVRRAVSSLPKKYYDVITLKDLEGCSYKDIARMLGVSQGTVMSRLHRGRVMLAQRLARFR